MTAEHLLYGWAFLKRYIAALFIPITLFVLIILQSVLAPRLDRKEVSSSRVRTCLACLAHEICGLRLFQRLPLCYVLWPFQKRLGALKRIGSRLPFRLVAFRRILAL